MKRGGDLYQLGWPSSATLMFGVCPVQKPLAFELSLYWLELGAKISEKHRTTILDNRAACCSCSSRLIQAYVPTRSYLSRVVRRYGLIMTMRAPLRAPSLLSGTTNFQFNGAVTTGVALNGSTGARAGLRQLVNSHLPGLLHDCNKTARHTHLKSPICLRFGAFFFLIK